MITESKVCKECKKEYMYARSYFEIEGFPPKMGLKLGTVDYCFNCKEKFNIDDTNKIDKKGGIWLDNTTKISFWRKLFYILTKKKDDN